MRPRFGTGVAVHALALDLPLAPGAGVEWVANAQVSRLPLLEARSRALLPQPEAPAVKTLGALAPGAPSSQVVRPEPLAVTSQPASWPFAVASRRHALSEIPVMSHSQLLPPLVTRAHDVRHLVLDAAAHATPFIAAPTGRRDLAAAKRQPASKRIVPARLLTPAQVGHWLERIGNAKRLTVRGIELVGVIPDVAIAGDKPVSYKAELGAIAYALPDKPVALSTVVIAKNRATGEMLLARFASE